MAAGDGDREWLTQMRELLHELWDFLSERKKLWLFPIVVLLVLLGALLVATQSSALAPFIYTVF